VLSDDEGMDVVRAFVCLDGFKIHHVAHDRVVLGNSVRAEDVSRDSRALQRHPHVVALGHGDVLMADGARVFQAADLKRE